VKVSWHVDDSYEFVAPRGAPRAGDPKLIDDPDARRTRGRRSANRQFSGF